MIEALLMCGDQQGPLSAWSFVGAMTILSSGTGPVTPKFPAGVQPGDLVVGIMSPLKESGPVIMTSTDWLKWGTRAHDYACAARYVQGLSLPRWEKSESNSVFAAVLAFRAAGWSTVQIESQTAPAAPVSVISRARNELLISIGITPGTTKAWVGYMPGQLVTPRVERVLAPAMQVYSANIESPRNISGVYVDAASGAERNLIISAF